MGMRLKGYDGSIVVITHPDCEGLIGVIICSWMDPGKLPHHVVSLGPDAPTIVLQRGEWRYAAEREKPPQLQLPPPPPPLANGGLRRMLAAAGANGARMGAS
jgi:hypothetical protein